ncbi:MAG: hypothetical protein IPL47_12265 [Phyllobacteriaceae bacterium]|nr:hypothetical protein [Phyllobacteriaceae bacterium]
MFANDTLNGAAFLPAAVTPTIADGGLTGVTINPDGTLTVPAATPAGVYPVDYRICEVANPANCDTAIASVTVGAGHRRGRRRPVRLADPARPARRRRCSPTTR